MIKLLKSKLYYCSLIALTVSLFLVGCKKNEEDSNLPKQEAFLEPEKPIDPTATPSVYIGGTESDVTTDGKEGKPIPTIWKDGVKLYPLSDGSQGPGCVYDLVVYNNEVFSCGYDGEPTALWRNDKILFDNAGDGIIYDIEIYKQNIYYGGKETLSETTAKASIWRNDSLLYSLTDGSKIGAVCDIAIVEDNIYSVGIDGKSAVVWKNDQKLYDIDTQHGFLWAQIAVSDNDVYVSGCIAFSQVKKIGSVWKNGEKLYDFMVADVPYANVLGMAVEGSDVYSSGYQYEDGIFVAKVWKNDKELYAINKNKSTHAKARGLAVHKGDIYVTGYETDSDGVKRARVWKNGVLLYDLGSANSTSYGLGVVVK